MSSPRMLRQQNFCAVGEKQWAWDANSYLLYSNSQTYSHLNDSLVEGINHWNRNIKEIGRKLPICIVIIPLLQPISRQSFPSNHSFLNTFNRGSSSMPWSIWNNIKLTKYRTWATLNSIKKTLTNEREEEYSISIVTLVVSVWENLLPLFIVLLLGFHWIASFSSFLFSVLFPHAYNKTHLFSSGVYRLTIIP